MSIRLAGVFYFLHVVYYFLSCDPFNQLLNPSCQNFNSHAPAHSLLFLITLPTEKLILLFKILLSH